MGNKSFKTWSLTLGLLFTSSHLSLTGATPAAPPTAAAAIPSSVISPGTKGFEKGSADGKSGNYAASPSAVPSVVGPSVPSMSSSVSPTRATPAALTLADVDNNNYEARAYEETANKGNIAINK